MDAVMGFVPEEEKVVCKRLSPKGDPKYTLQYLLGCVADGVLRPGAWERGWLEQAFGDEWRKRLEVDPDVPWHQRPRHLRDEHEVDEV
jgi:hypothetical protein